MLARIRERLGFDARPSKAAQDAVESAEKRLEDAQQRWPEVAAAASSAYERRKANHLTELFYQLHEGTSRG